MKILMFLLGSLLVVGCQSGTQSKAPCLGEEVSVADRSKRLMIAAAQMSPFTEITRGGIVYTVAVDDAKHAIYVACSDKLFQTPEGLGADATLEQVLAAGSSAVIEETGWAYYARLPSGWCALFYGFNFDGKKIDSITPPSGTTRVDLYFMRK